MKRRSKLIISCIFFQPGEHSGAHRRAEIGRAESNPKTAPWGAGRRPCGHFGEWGVGPGAQGSCAPGPQSCHLERVGRTQEPPGNPTGAALPRSIPQLPLPPVGKMWPLGRQGPSRSSQSPEGGREMRVARGAPQRTPCCDSWGEGTTWGPDKPRDPNPNLENQNETVPPCGTLPVTNA